MQTALSRFRTWVVDSNSYDDNRYDKSYVMFKDLLHVT